MAAVMGFERRRQDMGTGSIRDMQGRRDSAHTRVVADGKEKSGWI